MYLEKEDLLKKIDEFCQLRGIELSFDEKSQLGTNVLRMFDKHRLLDFDSFIELLEHNEQLETYEDLDFDDEIISIEEVGEIDMVDFDVSGNRLFYANDILTHNSAVNNIDDADNSSVSDSLGTVATADFLCFLLQNEEMKERKEIVCKVTKNRFNGRTDTWMMNIDYSRMRFSDMVVIDPDMDIDVTFKPGGANELEDDFGIVTSEKQKDAEAFAEQEVKDIAREDFEKLKDADKQIKEDSDPFSNDMDDMFKELGIDV